MIVYKPIGETMNGLPARHLLIHLVAFYSKQDMICRTGYLLMTDVNSRTYSK